MADVVFASPIPAESLHGRALAISDASLGPKSRIVGEDLNGIAAGEARRVGRALIYSTSPKEWTALGDVDHGMVSVDLTHVRAVIRITGSDSVRLLAKVCALDFGDAMFPNHSAARTSVANTTTEVVRDDREGERSYLLVASRSFAAYLHGVLIDQAGEFLEP